MAVPPQPPLQFQAPPIMADQAAPQDEQITGNPLQGFTNEIAKSGRAIAYLIGAYKPADQAEAKELRQRAMADGVFLALSALTEGAGGAVLKMAELSPAARVALAPLVHAAAGGFGGAGAAAVQGQNPVQGAIAPAIMGGVLGAIGGRLGGVTGKAAGEAATAGAAPIEEATAPLANIAQAPAPTPAQQMDMWGGGTALGTPRNAQVPMGGQLGLGADIPAPITQSSIPGALARGELQVGGPQGPFTEYPQPPYSRTGAFPQTLGGQRAFDALAKKTVPNDPELQQLYKDFLSREGAGVQSVMKGRAGRGPSTPRPVAQDYPGYPTGRQVGQTISQIQDASTPLEAVTAAEKGTNLWQKALSSPIGQYVADDLPLFDIIRKKGITSIQSLLEKFGTAGKTMAQRAALAIDTGRTRAGVMWDEVLPAFRQMTTEEAYQLDRIVRYQDKPTGELAWYKPIAETMWRQGGQVSDLAQAAELRTYDITQGKWHDFIPKEQWGAPKVWTEQSIAAMTPAEKELAVSTMIKRGWAKDSDEALEVLRRFGSSGGAPELLHGSLQISRIMDLPGYEKDPRVYWPAYLDGAHQRIAMAEQFGGAHEFAQKLIDHIGNKYGPAEANMANKAYSAIVGYRPWASDAPLMKALRTYRSGSMIQLLSPTSALKHGPQINNTMAVAGIGPTMRAVVQAFGAEGRSMATRMGVGVRDMIPDAMGEDIGKVASKWTDWIGLRPVVQANRVIAALAGKIDAEQTAQEFAKTQSPRLIEKLQKYHLDPQQVIAQRGILSDEQGRLAGAAMLRRTQLTSTPLDLPLFRNTMAGQFLGLFRSAAFQQTKTLNREVWQPLIRYVRSGGKEGDYGPMLRWTMLTGTYSVGVGEAIRAIRSLRYGSTKEPPEGGLRILQDAMSSGSLGMLGEQMETAATGDDARIAASLGGLPLSDAVLLLHSAGDLMHGNVRKVAGDLAERTLPSPIAPRVGDILRGQ